MALLTLGTNATSSLSAILYSGNMAAADVALMKNGIKDDLIAINPIIPSAFTTHGLVYIPNRGVLKALPGDYIAFDSTTGWPILLSATAIASGPYTHS